MKLLLSTICIALLALFAYQVMSYPLQDGKTHNTKPDRNLAKSIDFELPRLAKLNAVDEYSEIVKRPLFAKDRAADVSVKKVNEVKTVNELSHLILVGTASSSDVQIAIVADTKAKQMERLKTGESYNEWDISEISSDYVVFLNDELEYKLFVTPIKGSQKAKQAKLISQLSKSKIERATQKIKSYQANNNEGLAEEDFDLEVDKPKRKKSGYSSGYAWNYGKKSESTTNTADTENEASGKPEVASKPVKRSPIKIPDEEEKSAAYYEGLSDDDETSDSNNRNTVSREITAEDFYNDEDFSEEERKLLEGLGASIFGE